MGDSLSYLDNLLLIQRPNGVNVVIMVSIFKKGKIQLQIVATLLNF